MLDLTRLLPADLLYLDLCVDAGRVLPRSPRKPTQFVKMWLKRYASEHAGVTYLEKEQRLKYCRMEEKKK